MILILEITKGHHYFIMEVALRFLFSAYCLMSLIFVPSFMKISLTVKKLLSGHDFHIKKSKGHNSAKRVGGRTVLIL